nr:MAG TPA: hypothetical protein [Caudoviricetes sp.]
MTALPGLYGVIKSERFPTRRGKGCRGKRGRGQITDP